VRSPLCEAVVRCHLRRLRAAVGAAPLPGSVLCAGVVSAPLASVRIGHALGNGVAVTSAGVADAIVLGPMLAGAVAGAALAAALPEPAAFGRQIAAAPFDRAVGVVAVAFVPVLAGGLVVSPSLVAAAVALGSRLPGGTGAGLALAASTLATIPAGASLAEGWIAAARRRRRRPLLVGCAAGAWLAMGAALGAAPLGPMAVVSLALQGEAPSGVALAVSGASGLAVGLGWVLLAATRPEQPAARSGRARQLVRGRRGAIPAAIAALLGRRGDVRVSAAGAVAFGAAGAGLAAVAAAPAPAALLLGTTTALLGSLFCPLAAGGALLDGRWLWAGTPRGSAVVVGAAALVAVAGTAAPVGLVGAGAWVGSGASRSSAGVVAVLVVAGSATALLAGALVPWRRSGVGDQLTTFAAFAAVAVATSLAVGLVAPRIVATGAPDALVAGLAVGPSVVAALAALGSRLGRTAN